ncbi:MAG: hypothetical protein RIC55_13925 [Pirellulaceae bacterium]
MNDDFEQMAQISSVDAKADVGRRIQREQRLQGRSRNIRTACRLVILLAGGGGAGLLFAGLFFGWQQVAGMGCSLMCPTLLAAVVLFFMGGLIPTGVRPRLTDKQRDRLNS